MNEVKVSGGTMHIVGAVLFSEGLKESCPYCGNSNCYADCDGSMGDIDGLESEEQMVERRVSNAAIDGVESMVLLLVCAGKASLDDPAFVRIIEESLDAISNNLS